MDQLLSSFQGSFTVATNPFDTASPHPRLSQYKYKREGYGDQEVRRKKALEQQGARRKDFVDYSRKIVEGDLSDDDMEEEGYDEVDMADDAITTKPRPVKVKAPYRNQLMLSEWLVDVPSDFESNWYTIICPVAKRCLVISAKGVTISYSRSGHRMNSFPSHLPGGCKKYTAHHKSTYCILDCLYDSNSCTYYILDVMAWMSHPVYDSDTEFRNYWLNTKISENDLDLAQQTNVNPYKFTPLQYHTCTRPLLSELLSGPFPVQVDGLLFVHKRTHYCLGRTPLALWLKPHMVTDVLDVPVSPEFLACAPVLSAAGNTKMETDGLTQTTPSTKSKMEIEEHCKED